MLVGKLAMVELAGGGGYRFAAASLTGPGLNPWDRARWSGGSSSGSAAAVAAGLVPFAIGSETSGSILTPAAYCGVTALRPTYGLVSRYGAMALSWTLDKIGPFCRSAEDCGLVLQAIAGGDGRPGFGRQELLLHAAVRARAEGPARRLRAGGFRGVGGTRGAAGLRQALAAVRGTGAQLMETGLPDFPYGPVIGTIIAAEGSAVFEPLIASGKVDELADQKQIAGLRAGLEIPAKDYLKAMRIRRLIQQAFREAVRGRGRAAGARRGWARRPGSTEPLDRRSPSRPTPKDPGMPRLIPAGNLAGLPALCCPAASPRTCRWRFNWWDCRSPRTCCWRSAANTSPARTGTGASRRGCDRVGATDKRWGLRV